MMSNTPGAVSPKAPNNQGKISIKSLGALNMDSSNEPCTIKQTSSRSVATLTTMDNENSPYPVNMDIVRKYYA